MKKAFSFVLCAAFALLYLAFAQAATYGSGTYGSGFYSLGAANDTSEETSSGTESGGGSAGGGGGGGLSLVGVSSRLQFDIKIIDFESPIALGKSFNFTYFVKGVGDINHDVVIDFWVEKDGEILSSGSDVVFMGSNEEKTETATLYLSRDIEPGVYQFNMRVHYQSISAEAHRTVELIVSEGQALIEQLFDVRFSLEDAVVGDSDQLVAVVVLENFAAEPIPIDLSFIILNENGEMVHSEEDKATVKTENVLRRSFQGLYLSEGTYTLVLKTLYKGDVSDEFRHDFEINVKKAASPQNRLLYSVIGVLVALVAVLFCLLLLRRGRKRDVPDSVRQYVRSALAWGMRAEDTYTKLIIAGWPAEIVRESFEEIRRAKPKSPERGDNLDKVRSYILSALAHNMKKKDISEILIREGWQRRIVKKLFKEMESRRTRVPKNINK